MQPSTGIWRHLPEYIYLRMGGHLVGLKTWVLRFDLAIRDPGCAGPPRPLRGHPSSVRRGIAIVQASVG